MYISRYAGSSAIACNQDEPFFDGAVKSSVDSLDYKLLSLYHDVGGSIIVWRDLDPATYKRLDKELRKEGK